MIKEAEKTSEHDGLFKRKRKLEEGSKIPAVGWKHAVIQK